MSVDLREAFLSGSYNASQTVALFRFPKPLFSGFFHLDFPRSSHNRRYCRPAITGREDTAILDDLADLCTTLV